MHSLKLLSSAAVVALVAAAATPALAQVPSPEWVIEGPIDAITNNSITVMGVKINVPDGLADTPTKTGVSLGSLTGSLEGRPQGFLGGTAIVTAGSDHGTVTASNVFSDVNENVLVGEVSSVPGQPLKVNGLPVVAIPRTDPRIPANDPANVFGFKINESSIDQWSLISVEGYLGADGALHYHTLEADTGVPVNVAQTEVSILRAQCRDRADRGKDELEVRGAVHLAGMANVASQSPVPQVSLTYRGITSFSPLTVGDVTVKVTPIVDPATPQYGEYRYTSSNRNLAECPLRIKATYKGVTDTTPAEVDLEAAP